MYLGLSAVYEKGQQRVGPVELNYKGYGRQGFIVKNFWRAHKIVRQTETTAIIELVNAERVRFCPIPADYFKGKGQILFLLLTFNVSFLAQVEDCLFEIPLAGESTDKVIRSINTGKVKEPLLLETPEGQIVIYNKLTMARNQDFAYSYDD